MSFLTFFIPAVLLGIVAIATYNAFIRTHIIWPWQTGLSITKDGKQELLSPGRYRLLSTTEVRAFDTRLQTLALFSQEILTADTIAVKINLTADFNIADVGLFHGKAISPSEMAHTALQHALREAVASYTLESLLKARAEIASTVQQAVAPYVAEFGMALTAVYLRDIVLPGELKRAFAAASAAQKEGLASLERARAEHAALRSLANAAKLLEEHPGLMQLRSLQALEARKGNTLILDQTGRGPDAAGKRI